MNKEFENLLNLLENKQLENRQLGLQVAVNFKQEIEEYYECSFAKWKDIYEHCITKGHFYWFILRLVKIETKCVYVMTFDEFALRNRLGNNYDRDCFVEMKNSVIAGKFKKIEGFGEYSNEIVQENWQVIKHLII